MEHPSYIQFEFSFDDNVEYCYYIYRGYVFSEQHGDDISTLYYVKHHRADVCINNVYADYRTPLDHHVLCPLDNSVYEVGDVLNALGWRDQPLQWWCEYEDDDFVDQDNMLAMGVNTACPGPCFIVRTVRCDSCIG